MHTDATSEEKLTGSARCPAAHTDASSTPGPITRIKLCLMTVAAWLALVIGGQA